MVHNLCERYGWTLEYVANLTRPQLKLLARGSEEMTKLKKEFYDKERGHSSPTKITGNGREPISFSKDDIRRGKVNATGANFLSFLANGKSVSMSPRLKKKLAEIKKKKDAS